MRTASWQTRLFLGLWLSLMVVTPASAQRVDVEQGLSTWRQLFGENWQLRQEPGTGMGRFLFGGRRAAEFQPVTEDDWIALATLRLDEAYPLLGMDLSTLQPSAVRALDLSSIGTTDKTVVEFTQSVDGVPVEGGFVSALFGPGAELLALDTTGMPHLQAFDVVPAVGPDAAMVVARDEFVRIEGRPAFEVSSPELVIRRFRNGALLEARLAWAVQLSSPPGGGDPGAARRVHVAAGAAAGTVLEVERGVHAFDSPRPIGTPPLPDPPLTLPWWWAGAVFWGQGPIVPPWYVPPGLRGMVVSMATPGTDTDNFLNPPVPLRLENMTVLSTHGTAVTNDNGFFWIPTAAGVSGDVLLSFQGPWVQVFNELGAPYTLLANVSGGFGVTLTMNDPAQMAVTAQANAFRAVNRFHDWVADHDPSDTTLDFPVEVHVNDNGMVPTCNAAYFPGLSALYFAQENLFCDNFAFSTVVAHEMGHFANVLYGSGNGPDGFGEGAADAWAMYLYDTPFVGGGYGIGQRSGWNTETYCGDSYATYPNGCKGDVHTDGQVLMGALWKVRDNLINSLGVNGGEWVADTMFRTWFQAFNDSEIHSIIEEHWLVLDDDDGDLSDGSPHYAEIDAGFQAQGFPGYGLPTGPFFEEELLAVSPVDNEFAGQSVAYDGDTVIVGVPWDETFSAAISGTAHVYVRSGPVWTLQQVLSPNIVFTGQMFGHAVALDGDTAVIGAPTNNPNNEGAVWVFTRSGTTWTKQAQLVQSDTMSRRMGISVAVDGDTLIAGAPDNFSTPAGVAYVFTRSGTTWTQQQQLTSPYPAAGTGLNGFGVSVALSVNGGFAVVGDALRGVAHAFQRSGSTWGAPTQIGGGTVAGLGAAVAISEGWVALGSYVDTVQLYTSIGPSWVLREALVPSNPSDDRFGEALDIEGTRLLVGAESYPNAGAAYIYERSGQTWPEIGRIQSPYLQPGDAFGRSVALEGTRAVVGAPAHDNVANADGAAFVFVH